ncbi:MAG: hypothetical protein R3F62_31290 [Planctomycetota bacterium]
MTPSLRDRLSNLELELEGYALRPLEHATPAGWTRKTTVVALQGGGLEGQGEDVTYQTPDQDAFQAAGPVHDLRGRWTLGELSQHLDTLALFPAPPQDPKSTLYRRWAFESAALDLALRQAETSLAAFCERTPRPLTYVVSLGLGSPASLAPLDALWAAHPDARLKLDADLDWTAELIAGLAATGRVACVDLKGQYTKGPFTGTPPDAALYTRVAEGLPQAWLEDPGWTPETKAALKPHLDRVTFDAPLCSLADVEQVQPFPRCVNVKPSRFGRLDELFRVYAWCEARGVAMYGGGQFELGPGRTQIQLLASLFHPDTPNDVAPAGFNQRPLPTDLPASPLAVENPAGFR